MSVGQRVVLFEDQTKTVYVVAGVRPNRGYWLTVEDDQYDGYDGDLILTPESGQTNRFRCVLRDTRSALPICVTVLGV